jgi:hypothetical protein
MFCGYDTIGYVSFKRPDIYNTHFLRLSFLDIQWVTFFRIITVVTIAR